MKDILTVRAAEERDIAAIRKLIAIYVKKGTMLDRDEADIRFYLGNFVVAEANGVLRGCAAVRDFGGDLLEVRSLVVDPDFQGKGIGRALVESIISGLSIRRKTWRLFTLTYQVDFFRKMGFEIVDRAMFPEKIWSDCARCPKQKSCDEVALLISSK